MRPISLRSRWTAIDVDTIHASKGIFEEGKEFGIV
jgi:hypothetical protein